MDEKKKEYPLTVEAQTESTNLRTLEDKWAEHCGGKLLKYDGMPENISALKKEMGEAAGECGMVLFRRHRSTVFLRKLGERR